MKRSQRLTRVLPAAIAGLALLSLPAFGQQDPNLGRNLGAACAVCHGTNGANAGGGISLAGQGREQIARAMRDFRDGKRPATIMHQISKGYTEDQIDALAVYFAAQKAK